MKSIIAITSLAFVTIVSGINASPASADVISASMAPNLCLDVNQSTNPMKVALFPCHGGANQNFFTSAYGPQKFNGMCLDSNGTAAGSGLVMTTCNSSKPSQRWSLVSTINDQNALGSFRNESGWCINIPGGNANPNVQVVIWTCPAKTAGSRSNDVWGSGTFKPISSLSVPALAKSQLAQVGTVTTVSGSLVASGAGNFSALVASGAGNIVAAGAGNIVAAGAGNVIQGIGGAFIRR